MVSFVEKNRYIMFNGSFVVCSCAIVENAVFAPYYLPPVYPLFDVFGGVSCFLNPSIPCVVYCLLKQLNK